MWKIGYGPAPGEVILVVEIFVTCNQVRCILYSGGLLAKKLEKETGCLIRVHQGGPMRSNPECISLCIIGSYFSSQVSVKLIWVV